MKKILNLLGLLLLSACKSEGVSAEQSTQIYLQALADKNQALMISRTCPEFEMDALLELDALALVQTTLENVSCRQVSGDAQTAQVVCSGHIVTSYNGENQNIDLSTRTYMVINEKESWLVCGYEK